MSFKISKPSVADLRKNRPIVSRAEAVACGLCKKAQSRYSCPTCNVPYCSLECFRGEDHRICSEGFYRASIEEDIRSAPERTAEEKKSMMDILRRMAEPDAFPAEEETGEENDGDGLASNLQGLDIGSTDTETLWDALSPSQREAFVRAMEDPDSPLARQLLSSVDSVSVSLSPWWEEDDMVDIPNVSGRPSAIQFDDQLLASARRGWSNEEKSLLFNVIALCFAYTFCIRSLRFSSFGRAEPQDAETCRQLIGRATPFLTDRTSTTRLESIDGAIGYVQSRLAEPLHKLSVDLSVLFQSTLVVDVGSHSGLSAADDSIGGKLLTCLGDIATLYSHPSTSESIRKKSSPTDKATVRKLAFYAAHITAAPLSHLTKIQKDLMIISARSAEEEDEGEGTKAASMEIAALPGHGGLSTAVEPQRQLHSASDDVNILRDVTPDRQAPRGAMDERDSPAARAGRFSGIEEI